jgi:hypothetical protein
MTARWTALALALLAACACGARPDAPLAPPGPPPEPIPFLRFVPAGDDAGRLETAVASYEGPRGLRVDLVASAHVADAAYYRRLRTRFDGYEAVLYEMVKPAGYVPRPGDRAEGFVSLFQRGIRNLLDLEFQLDAIDYSRRNFVHADLDTATFASLQKERQESLVGMVFEAAMRAMAAEASGEGPATGLTLPALAAAFASEDSARALKLLLAREIENLEALLAGIDEGKDGEGSVLVTERNKRAIRVLRRQIDRGRRRIAIFYGAAHMPDLEKRLTGELGLRRTAVEWEVAWNIPARAPSGEGGANADGG